MNTVIDLGSELLVDGSKIYDPYLRFFTAAVGQKLVSGSPWVAVNKRVAALCCQPSIKPVAPNRRPVANGH